MDTRHTIGLMLICAALAACSGPSGSALDDGSAGQNSGAAGTSGLDNDGVAGGNRFGDSDAGDGSDTVQDRRVVYFDFDQSNVSSDDRRLLQDHGRYLANNPGIQVRLEGHADERGSREYNVGLGEARAQAVRQLLLLQGVATEQLTTVSYGEERPAVSQGGEDAWSLNRRVELIYGPSS